MGPRRAGEATRPQKGIACHERLHADRPQSTLGIEMYVAFLLERGQQPMRSRWREPDLLRDFGQGGALVGRGQSIEESERADERFDLVGSLRGPRRGRPALWGGVRTPVVGRGLPGSGHVMLRFGV